MSGLRLGLFLTSAAFVLVAIGTPRCQAQRMIVAGPGATVVLWPAPCGSMAIVASAGATVVAQAAPAAKPAPRVAPAAPTKAKKTPVKLLWRDDYLPLDPTKLENEALWQAASLIGFTGSLVIEDDPMNYLELENLVSIVFDDGKNATTATITYQSDDGKELRTSRYDLKKAFGGLKYTQGKGRISALGIKKVKAIIFVEIPAPTTAATSAGKRMNALHRAEGPSDPACTFNRSRWWSPGRSVLTILPT